LSAGISLAAVWHPASLLFFKMIERDYHKI